jgi:hypothetical protein
VNHCGSAERLNVDPPSRETAEVKLSPQHLSDSGGRDGTFPFAWLLRLVAPTQEE